MSDYLALFAGKNSFASGPMVLFFWGLKRRVQTNLVSENCYICKQAERLAFPIET